MIEFHIPKQQQYTIVNPWELKKPKKQRTKKKTKREPIFKAVRDALALKYFKKKNEIKCYCCRKATINILTFQVGHNKAKSKGGSDNINNLRPICVSCNLSMGNKFTIEAFRKKFFKKSRKKKSKKKKKRKKCV